MSVCPYCNKPLIRNHSFCPPHITLCCRGCGVARLEFATEWVRLGPGMYERLQAQAPVVEVRTRSYSEIPIDWSNPGFE
jgi:hypothetical protein